MPCGRAPDRSRTCDLRYRKPALYPLSYGGERGPSLAGEAARQAHRRGGIRDLVRGRRAVPHLSTVQRHVTSTIEFTLGSPADVVYSVAAHQLATLASEELTILADGEPIEVVEAIDRAECRLHRISTDASRVTLEYRATIDGFAAPNVPAELDRIHYRRPSRYAESDILGSTSRALFRGLKDFELLDAVVDWVSSNLRYVRGSSLPTDGARDTFLKRQGVCRDYAHLVIALLRAHDVPARLVSVYAPGLEPMDFHAVVEALIDGQWWVVDATRLAPRHLMQRIATGRDASDTAFLSYTLSNLKLTKLLVMATADEFTPEDPSARVQLR